VAHHSGESEHVAGIKRMSGRRESHAPACRPANERGLVRTLDGDARTFLSNRARRSVDEAVLERALRRGWIAGAALDVVEHAGHVLAGIVQSESARPEPVPTMACQPSTPSTSSSTSLGFQGTNWVFQGDLHRDLGLPAQPHFFVRVVM
jgi:hypothetical protein